MAHEKFRLGKLLIAKISIAIDDLILGKTKNKYWGSQNTDWYSHKKEQFLKSALKYSETFQKIENGTYKDPVLRNKNEKIIVKTPVPSVKVSKCLYEFCSQLEISNEKQKCEENVKAESVFETLNRDKFSLNDFFSKCIDEQNEIKELITQYIMFLELNKNLLFEADFLDGTTKKCLGKNLLTYICKHKWPFPQMRPNNRCS